MLLVGAKSFDGRDPPRFTTALCQSIIAVRSSAARFVCQRDNVCGCCLFVFAGASLVVAIGKFEIQSDPNPVVWFNHSTPDEMFVVTTYRGYELLGIFKVAHHPFPKRCACHHDKATTFHRCGTMSGGVDGSLCMRFCSSEDDVSESKDDVVGTARLGSID
jgi:hypothetical protein